MDLVHVVRHKVLVEGRMQRAVARELGLSRTTVGKYVDQAAPVRPEAGPRPRPTRYAMEGLRRLSQPPLSTPMRAGLQ
jgi:TrfB plasmid transcriptional repressor